MSDLDLKWTDFLLKVDGQVDKRRSFYGEWIHSQQHGNFRSEFFNDCLMKPNLESSIGTLCEKLWYFDPDLGYVFEIF